jgi:hypothetical protein
MRCRLPWIALPLLLLSTAVVFGNPKNPPKPPPPPKPHPNQMPKLVTTHIDYELDPTSDLVVRLLNPPVQYDDKGFPKKYTAAELKELKGDNPKLPGYKGDVSDLKTGIQVRVSVVKDPPPPKEDDKKDDKKDDTKADKPQKEDKPDAKADKPKYIYLGDLTGQLTQTGNSQKGLRLRVTYQTWQAANWRPPHNNGDPKNLPKLEVEMIVVLTQPAQDAPPPTK